MDPQFFSPIDRASTKNTLFENKKEKKNTIYLKNALFATCCVSHLVFHPFTFNIRFAASGHLKTANKEPTCHLIQIAKSWTMMWRTFGVNLSSLAVIFASCRPKYAF